MGKEEKEIYDEVDKEHEYEEEEENGALCHSQTPNTSLAELNMLLVTLSLVYFPNDDDCIHSVETEHIIRDQVGTTKTCMSKLETKKREKNEPKQIGKKSFSSRFQTTIKDSR